MSRLANTTNIIMDPPSETDERDTIHYALQYCRPNDDRKGYESNTPSNPHYDSQSGCHRSKKECPNKSPFLKSYSHKVDAKSHPLPLCSFCNTHIHDTHHHFNCTQIVTPGFVDRPRRSDCTAGKQQQQLFLSK